MGFLASVKKSVSGPKEKKSNFHSEYRLGRSLGEGGFATVYSCTAKKGSDDKFAVKVFDMRSRNAVRKDFRLEVQIMKQIGTHQSCVQFIEAFEDKRFCYLIMEKCSCNILDAFLGKESATESELAQAFRSLLQAVDHLHSVRVVHRDIKPCNILLKDSGRGENLDVKICDMGLAAMMPKEGSTRFGCIPVRAGLTEVCGTTPYMPPEMLRASRPYSELVDEWSCGVTMYVLLFGEFPYKTIKRDMDLMRETIIAGRVMPSFKTKCKGFAQPSPLACELVAALMTRDVEARPTVAQALTYPFLELCLPKPPAPEPDIETNQITNVDQFIVPSDSFHTIGQLPSFHPTLLHAKSELEEYEERTPLEKKRSVEEALGALQKEQGQQWQRHGARCSSEPSTREKNELQRLPARLSTHSGTSIATHATLGESDTKLALSNDISLPGTPSTTDGDCDPLFYDSSLPRTTATDSENSNPLFYDSCLPHTTATDSKNRIGL